MNKSKFMKTIIFIVILLIPVIYSFFYLKSYWDPYGNLQDLKVAIVNLDKGEDDQNQGNELVQSLIDSGTIKICTVSEDEAQDGLVNGRYYAKITIPEDFTKSLNNAENADREKTVITYSPNKKSNYLAYQIINNVVTKTELSLQAKVSEKVVASLKEKLEEVPTKMEEINDGVGKVKDGADTLNGGLKTLEDGTNTLKTNYDKFDTGITSSYEGSKSLESGMNSVKEGTQSLVNGTNDLSSAVSQIQAGTQELSSKTGNGIQAINSGVTKLAEGSNNLDSSLGKYVTGVNNLNEKNEQIIDGVIAMGKKSPELLQNTDFQKLYYGATQIKQSGSYETITQSGKQIKAGSESVKSGMTSLKSSMSSVEQIATGIQKLNLATSQVNEGVKKLSAGTNSLNLGVSKVQEGTKTLNNGLQTLSSSSKDVKQGISKLAEGSKQAYDGGITLSNGVNTLQTEISTGIDDTKKELTKLDGLDTYTEDPIEIKEESYGEVDKYGISFTPLFLSIGLWVGALMSYVILYYDQEKRYKLLGKFADNKLLQIALYLGIAIIQGLVTGALLKWGLGFNVQNTALYYASCAIIAIAFMSVIQFLIMNFGDIGKFIALIVLVLQLAASGGTFPVETINKGFQAFTNFLPMTYAIRLLKESLILMDTGFASKNILVLSIFTMASLLITVIVTIIKGKKVKKDSIKENKEANVKA
ncbi:phage infection protein YhgE [Clostridium sp. CAG:571]|jgi:putative membrane protein|nr:phage infection protein YhgE [Clostridium sp. CAG:571]HJJ06859.1 YhgE/Pip domain-containing protein [Clostridiaceae bacterium]